MPDLGEPAGPEPRATGWGPVVGWTVLAGVAQLSALGISVTGTRTAFHHLRPPWELAADPPWLPLAVLALQAALVGRAVVRRRRELHARVRATIGWGRVAALVGAMTAVGTVVTRDLPAYGTELLLAGFLHVTALLNLGLAALALPAGTTAALGSRAGWLVRALGPAEGDDAEVRVPGWVVPACAVAVTVAAGVLAFTAYQRHPHIPDELAYLIQSAMFADGRVAMPLPPVPEAFVVDLMVYTPERWYSTFAPGWPAMLAVGTSLGAPWLVNPILSGVNVLLVHGLLRRWTTAGMATVAAILFAASPWNLFLGMSFMSHTFTLTAALVATLAVARLRTSGALRWAVMGGIGIGVVSLCRPLDGVALAVPLGLWALLGAGRRLHPVRAGALAMVTAAVAAVILPYNRALTGDARAFPVMVFWDAVRGPGSNALGFGPDRGLGWPGVDPFPGHGPLDVIVNANLNIAQTDLELFGWAFGSLLPVLFLLVAGRVRRADATLLATVGWIAGVQSLYWFSGGPDFGARYWHLAIVPAALLTARGLQEGIRVLRLPPARVLWLVASASVLASAVFVPWKAFTKYRGYRGMDPGVRALEPARRGGPSLVLIRGDGWPDYASAAAYTPLDPFAEAPVYAWDRLPSTTDRVLWTYRDREVWIVEGPTVTGGGFRVLRGPLSADSLLAERGITQAPEEPGNLPDLRTLRGGPHLHYEDPTPTIR